MFNFCILVQCLLFTLVLAFDPSKFDYCKIKCQGIDAPHTACKCTTRGKRKEVTEEFDPLQFRQIVLDRHNELRNSVANGSVHSKYPDAPAATNMRAMNYDVELEYIARCHALSYEVKSRRIGHDKCRRGHNEKSVGQNIYFQTDSDQKRLTTLNGWFGEAKDLESTTISSFGMSSKGVVGHFTQMVWAEADLVGCSRVHDPDQSFPYYLICNYGSTTGRSGGNMAGDPVYLVADGDKKPCSACPEGMPCGEDKRYDALCGKILPVPQEIPETPGGSSAALRGNGPSFGVVMLVLCVLIVHRMINL